MNVDEHLAAIARSRDKGFRFIHLRQGGDVTVIHGERRLAGAVDTYTVRSAEDATAARYRLQDYGLSEGKPLWRTTGTVASVVGELLALPPNGAPGAPR